MSKDLLEAAYRDFDKAVQQHEQSKTHASEKALYEARINVLSIRNDLRERKIKMLSREVERLQETLALAPDMTLWVHCLRSFVCSCVAAAVGGISCRPRRHVLSDC